MVTRLGFSKDLSGEQVKKKKKKTMVVMVAIDPNATEVSWSRVCREFLKIFLSWFFPEASLFCSVSCPMTVIRFKKRHSSTTCEGAGLEKWLFTSPIWIIADPHLKQPLYIHKCVCVCKYQSWMILIGTEWWAVCKRTKVDLNEVINNTMYYWLRKVSHWELCQRLKFDHVKKDGIYKNQEIAR